LVVGAVFVARAVTSDPGSQAQVKDIIASPVASSKDAKKAETVAADVACKKACIEVQEVANDSITTAKLAPGSVTLSKLAFEVPNLNELENEINARKAAEATAKSAQAEALANGAKNDAAITSAANNGITQEAAARAAADEDVSKKFAAADADLVSKLNKEVADRGAGDDTLQLKLNTEVADRAGAIASVRGELGNPNQVASPIVQINNNEIVADAVTTDKILDRTIGANDLASTAVVGRAVDADPLTNVKVQTLRGERKNNASSTLAPGDLAVGTITGERTPTAGAAVGNIALGTITGETDNDTVRTAPIGNVGFKTIGRNNIVDDAIDTTKIAPDTILAGDIAPGAVGTSEILNGTILNEDLAGNSVTTDKIVDNTIKGEDVSVTDATNLRGANIGRETVTGEGDNDTSTGAQGNLALATVGRGNVVDSAINSAKLADDTVAAIDLADGAVVGRAIAADSSLVNVKLGTLRGEAAPVSGGTTTGDVALGTISGQGDNDNSVAIGADNTTVNGNLALATVGRRNLVDDVIDSSKIADDTVAASDLADGAVVGRAIAADSSLVNVKLGTLRGEAAPVSGGTTTGDVALGTITGQGDNDDSVAPGADNTTVNGNLGLGTVGRRNLVDGAVNGAKVADGSITDAKLDANGVTKTVGDFITDVATGTAASTSTNLVSWNSLGDLPDSLASATDSVLGCTDCIGATELAGGAVGTAELANASDVSGRAADPGSATGVTNRKIEHDAVQGGKAGVAANDVIKDGSITSDDLAGTYGAGPGFAEVTVGAVTSEKIADGAIQARDLSDSSVTTDKMLANVVGAAAGTGTLDSSSLPGSLTADVATATLPLTGGDHKVVLSGQFVATCGTCGPTPSTVVWVLRAGASTIGSWTASVSSTNPAVVLPVNGLDVITAGTAGPRVYTIKVTSPGPDMALTGGTLNAVDLGR
jgi:hypothetical protein